MSAARQRTLSRFHGICRQRDDSLVVAGVIYGIAWSRPRSPYPSDGLTQIRAVGGFNMCAADPDSRFVTEGRYSHFPHPDRHYSRDQGI